MILLECTQLSHWCLLAFPQLTDIAQKFHLLYGPERQGSSVADCYKFFTVWAEVEKFDALAQIKFSQIPEVHVPHAVIGTRVFLCVCEKD